MFFFSPGQTVRWETVPCCSGMGHLARTALMTAEKHLVTPHAPLGFGLTLSASMLFAMPYTGAGIK